MAQSNLFDSVQSAPVEYNRFDHSHDVKLSFKMGSLVPIACMEVLPGDRFDIDFVNMLRFAPLISPVMHRVKVITEYFFVPNRIIWPNWEDFITGVGDPIDRPWIHIEDGFNEGTLADYLGCPPGNWEQNPYDVSALPVAAYLKIWDDWYRYAPVIAEKFIPLVAGDNTDDYYSYFANAPLNRAWEHDYFTSALPDTQQGAQVSLPLTFQDDIPVEFKDINTPGTMRNYTTGEVLGVGDITQAAGPVPFGFSTFVGATGAAYDPQGTLVVDVQAIAATINDLREAFALQSFLERTLRGGERYIEQIWSHFQVKSSDARLQRPEFLGRSVQQMTISEVLSTAQSSNDPATANVPVGQMAGHGISVGGGNHISFTAEEHGFVIGIISVLPETAYQDGLHRMWDRKDRFDYAWPSFAHLGERAITLREIMAKGWNDPTDLDAPFGYLPQYSEYRTTPSRVAGEMRTTLNFWHLGRQFDGDDPPTLSEDFITCRADENSGLTRIFAVTDPAEDHIFAHVLNRVSIARKLPRYGVPKLLG